MSFNLKKDPENVFFRCVEDSNEAIMISDAQGMLVYVNPAWERIYGYARDEAIGNNPSLLHSGHQPPEFYGKMWAQIRDPEVGFWKGELINRAKDGTLVPVLLTITPFRSQDGEMVGYMGMALDYTYKKEMEAKIVHQDRLASVGLLASGLAHEIGTPLGVIRGRAEYLMMRSGDPLSAKNLEVIVSQIDRISKLIRSLLRISRSSSDVHLTEVNVQGVVREVFTLLGQNLQEDRALMKVDIPEELWVRADAGRLEQILLNLVMNSIHAIQKAIGEGRAGPHRIGVTAEQRATTTSIVVKDTGCGIPPENMKKLFKPFFTTKQVGEGTGLGLAIVAQLVREMGGEISAHSIVGEGTSFTLVLRNH